MAITKKLFVSAEILTEVAKASASVGLLPIDARKGKEISVSEDDVMRLVNNKNMGAIKGLIYAGNGKIHTEYRCTLAADAENARVIKGKDGKADFTVPSWEATEESDVIELADIANQPVNQVN